MSSESIVVRTHVARDLLHNAALFKTDKLVVWEYVSNGLQYVDPGVSPIVRVTIDPEKKLITISDNGRGMDQSGLRNYFIMHGENLDRKVGRPGRGRFGTGKCAAFGIADCLRVTSVRGGRRNTVELRRSDIEHAGGGEIRVRSIEQDTHTEERNGTTVHITGVKVRRLDQRGVIHYIERHLAHWPNRPVVFVNSHECEYVEPAIDSTVVIVPDDELRERLGAVRLILKTSKAPLDPDLQGVSIFANGSWLETTLAGAEGRPMSQYIFGEIDVPSLDDDGSPIPAFDVSRSMQLNRSNELVQALLGFVGREVDRLRRDLVKRDQVRRTEEEARKLDREAARISQMINQDFREFSDRIARVKATALGARDRASDSIAGGDDPDLVPGNTIPAVAVTETGGIGHGDTDGDSNHGQPPNLGPVLRPEDAGPTRADPAGSTSRKRQQGGFRVEFQAMGEEESRAVYHRAERVIFVNLDHPQICAAKGVGGVEDAAFRRLAYEVAFSEYAVALASELAARDEYIEPSDAIFDIRETLNRMARRAASLYA